jgi:PilZ domain
MLGLSMTLMPHLIRHRRYERVGLRKGPFVAWQGPAGRNVSRVATLGLGGLFIEASAPAATGDGIKVVLAVPEGVVRARAMVRNSHPGKGMGVEFTSMHPEHRARLRRLVSKLLAA